MHSFMNLFIFLFCFSIISISNATSKAIISLFYFKTKSKYANYLKIQFVWGNLPLYFPWYISIQIQVLYEHLQIWFLLNSEIVMLLSIRKKILEHNYAALLDRVCTTMRKSTEKYIYLLDYCSWIETQYREHTIHLTQFLGRLSKGCLFLRIVKFQIKYAVELFKLIYLQNFKGKRGLIFQSDDKRKTSNPLYSYSHMLTVYSFYIWLIGQISGSSCMTYPIAYAILSKFLLRLRLSFRLPLMRPMRNKYL